MVEVISVLKSSITIKSFPEVVGLSLRGLEDSGLSVT